jgi:hypothetical protein
VAQEVTPEQPKVDLDNPRDQELILHPEGTDVALSYGSVRLYPPSMMLRKLCNGFAKEIIADAAETNPKNAQMYMLRVASVLMRAPGPMMRLFRLVGFMCGHPGAIDEPEAIEFATELAEKTNEDDVAVLFAALCSNCGINKRQSEAKK